MSETEHVLPWKITDDELPEFEKAGEEEKKAAEKAMNLLLSQERTKKELEDRLYRAGFSETATQYAILYVTGFGYIDDRRYATNYLSYHKGSRSRKELQYKLLNKGVPKDILTEVFMGYESEDEQEALRRMLSKRLKDRKISELDAKEKNKIISYLARKGYSLPAIRAAMREQENME